MGGPRWPDPIDPVRRNPAMPYSNKMMVLNALCAAALLTLSACGGGGDDQGGDQEFHGGSVASPGGTLRGRAKVTNLSLRV